MAFRATQRVATELLVKKSRFIAVIYPVTDKQDVSNALTEVQQDYPSANHYCYAYYISGQTTGSDASACGAFSDDGEPKGCAGKPIYHVLSQQTLEDTLIVVVRYFGGIKLGASGLVRAYTNAAAKVLTKVELAAVVTMSQVHIECPHKDEHRLRRLLSAFNGSIDNVSYQHTVRLEITLAEHHIKALCDRIRQHGHGQWHLTWPDGING